MSDTKWTDVKHNNPAGRLYQLLDNGSTRPHAAKMDAVWSDLLRIQVGDLPALLQALGHVLALPAKIRREVMLAEPDHPAIYLKELPPIENAMPNAVLLDQQWGAFIQQVTPAAMYGLEMCDHILSRTRPTVTPSSQQLADLRGQVDDLNSALRDSSLPEATIAYMLKHLAAIEDALRAFHVAGSDPLIAAAEAALGGLYTATPEIRESLATAPEGPRFWTIVGRALIIVDLAVNSLVLPGAVLDALSLGADAPRAIEATTSREPLTDEPVEPADLSEPHEAPQEEAVEPER